MLTMAAGLAAGGMRPWVFIYSTFLQRAMDQLMHDIALQNLPVVIMVDRAGLSGSDGDTHQGVLDISWCRAIPNLEIYAPCDENSLKEAMLAALKRNGPTLIRYPRGSVPEKNLAPEIKNNGIVKISDAQNPGRLEKRWAVAAHGAAVKTMIQTRELAKLNHVDVPDLYDVRKIKPLDFHRLDKILESYELVAVIEENYMPGGLGEAVAARIAEKNFNVKLIRFGVPDVCVKHATQDEQRELYGLTPENILNECIKNLAHEEN